MSPWYTYFSEYLINITIFSKYQSLKVHKAMNWLTQCGVTDAQAHNNQLTRISFIACNNSFRTPAMHTLVGPHSDLVIFHVTYITSSECSDTDAFSLLLILKFCPSARTYGSVCAVAAAWSLIWSWSLLPSQSRVCDKSLLGVFMLLYSAACICCSFKICCISFTLSGSLWPVLYFGAMQGGASTWVLHSLLRNWYCNYEYIYCIDVRE